MSDSDPIDPQHPRLRVLLLAPYLDRDDVGESWSNWQWASGLSRRHEVTVLTTRRAGQAPIAPTLQNARVIEWTDPPLLRRFERFDSMLKPGYVPYYFRARAWLREARAVGRKFDVVHQLAPLAMRYPSPAVGLADRLVIGPIGGSLDAPPGLDGDKARRPWFVRLRGLDRLRFSHDPMLRRSYAAADCLITVAPYAADLLSEIPVRRFEFASETGVVKLPDVPATKAQDGVLRLLYVGRVVRTKGLRDAVRAISIAAGRGVRLHLDAVGTGDDLEACRAEAKTLGIEQLVTFHGKRPRADLDAFYRRADVFLFPSFREPSGNVVLEAMSYGLPLIVSSVGGPGHVVRDAFGVRVEPGSADQFANHLADAVCRMTDATLRKSMSNAARNEVEARHLWGTKIALLCSLYESLVHQNSPRPASLSEEAPPVGRRLERWPLGAVASTPAGVRRA